MGEATLIGERGKVAVSSAIIANETMVRYLDYNDVLYFPKSPGKIGGAHPSDALPAALAVGEREHASGKRVIEATVAAYETIGRMVDAFAEGLTPMGFHHGSVMSFAGAVIAGKLIGLDAAQMTHAMGIGASAAIGLAINDAEGEEYNNTKNIADGLMAERGVFAALSRTTRLYRTGAHHRRQQGLCPLASAWRRELHHEAAAERLLSDAHQDEILSDRVDQPGASCGDDPARERT